MLAMTIGFKKLRGEPEVLYCGSDAGKASDLSLSPPPGYVHTQLLKAPPVTRNRYFPENVAAPEAPEPKKKSAPKAKPEAPQDDLLPETGHGE
jgi:hypothetical protein